MRILAITQSKDILGGANRSFLDVISQLRDYYGHEIFVISPGIGEFTEELDKRKIEYMCAQYNQVSFVHRGDYKDPVRYVRSVLRDFNNRKSALNIAKKVKSKKFDLVYINDTTNTVGYYIAKRLRIPFVWHFRGYHESIKKYMVRDRAFGRDESGMSIAISKAMEHYMIKVRKMQASRITMIHNGVVNIGTKISQPWNRTVKNGVHCVHCGHLSEAKGQIDSITAIAELKKRGYKDIYLHLAGSPLVAHGKSYKDILQELVRRYGLEEQVVFEGEVKNMGDLRSKMQVELVCSLAEPFGRVTVEGMQAGLVVIGCDTGAIPEIITNNVDGLLYHQGNASDLADKIESVYINHELGNKLSAAALKTTETRFTMQQNVEQINQIILKMGNNR